MQQGWHDREGSSRFLTELLRNLQPEVRVVVRPDATNLAALLDDLRRHAGHAAEALGELEAGHAGANDGHVLHVRVACGGAAVSLK